MTSLSLLAGRTIEMLDNILEAYCNFNLHNGCLNDIASAHIFNKKANISSRNTSTRVSNDLDQDQDQHSVAVCKGYQQRTKVLQACKELMSAL